MTEHVVLPGLVYDQAVWDDLVDRLAVYNVTYLTGGSADYGRESPYRTTDDVDIHSLIHDLARAPEPRLRDALIALLLRHPELAPTALDVAGATETDDSNRLLIRVSVLVAAALRTTWSFVLGIYLPGQPSIDADDVAAELGVPRPCEDYGRPCIAAVAELLRADQGFPFDYEGGWDDVAGHVLQELRFEARERGA